HLHEALVTRAASIIEHHHPQHVQDVSALRIDHEACDATRLAAVEAVALRDRTDCVGLAVARLRACRDDKLALILPEIQELIWPTHNLRVERGGELGEAFAHPLVAVALPAERVSPPLVC